MGFIDAILHPTDFSPGAKAAFGQAVQMARKRGATLHILNVAPSLGEHPVRFSYRLEMGEETAYKQAGDKAQALTAALLDEAGADDLEIVRAHERGMAPGPVVVAYAEQHEIDLIVMGTHGRRGVRRFLLGSVAEEVVRRALCSVMTVPGARETVTEPPPSIERLLVPVDLSEFTVPLFQAAKDIAATYEAHIDLLHVVEPLPFPLVLMGGIALDDLVPDPVGHVEQQLAHLIETVEGPGTVEMHVEEGHAATAIIERARSLGSDLIAMASHGRTGLEGFLLGSVTARVVRRAGCPVLVARIEPEETPAASPSRVSST